MTKNSSESQPKSLRTRLGERLWGKTKERNGLPELSAESAANIAEANSLLENHCLVVYANHMSIRDAEIAVTLALSKLSNAKRFLVPAGMRHYDLGRDMKNGILLRALRILNVHVIPVVQKSDLESYPEAKRAQLLLNLKTRTERLFAKKGSVYGITPEGTRNKETGQLQQANTGIAQLEKYAPKDRPLIYVPVAIILNKFSNQPEVVVGEPQTLAQTIDSSHKKVDLSSLQQVADMHMYRLSTLMQEHMRGYYS